MSDVKDYVDYEKLAIGMKVRAVRIVNGLTKISAPLTIKDIYSPSRGAIRLDVVDHRGITIRNMTGAGVIPEAWYHFSPRKKDIENAPAD